MKHFVAASIVFVVLLLAASPHLATTDPQDQPTARKLSPMMQDIHASLAQSNAEVLALQQQLTGAPDEERALEILRAIALKKQDAEISVLRIQQQYARRDGNLEAATEIEKAIGKILHPDPIKPNAEALKAREERETGGRDHE